MFYGAGQEFAMLEDALRAGGMAWWLMELPAGIVYYSPSKITMLGFSEKDTNNFIRYTDFTQRLHPDDYEAVMQAMRDHLSGAADLYETQYRIRRKDDSYTSFYDRGRIVARNEQGEVAVAGIILNILENTRFQASEGKQMRML